MARHGENIRKRADGRWEGRYKLFNEEKGKHVYYSVYGHSYQEVKTKLAEKKKFLYKKEKRKNQEKEAYKAILFSQAASEWLETVSHNYKQSTYIKYSTIYRVHLAKPLDSYRISAIHQNILQEKDLNHLSKSLQQSVYCVVNQILQYASNQYSVPVSTLKKPNFKTEKIKPEIFSKTEQARLLNYLYQDMDKYKAAVLVCLHTGLRLGELCALKWQDIDYWNQVISVNQTVQRIAIENMAARTVLMETSPKSIFSKREIPVSSQILEILDQLQNGQDYIFGGPKPLEPRNMQYQFRKILKRAGINHKNFHTLRHTFATNCVENCVDAKSLSGILGHSDVKITLNRYVHPTMDLKREHMSRLTTFYGQIHGQDF